MIYNFLAGILTDHVGQHEATWTRHPQTVYEQAFDNSRELTGDGFAGSDA